MNLADSIIYILTWYLSLPLRHLNLAAVQSSTIVMIHAQLQIKFRMESKYAKKILPMTIKDRNIKYCGLSFEQ